MRRLLMIAGLVLLTQAGMAQNQTRVRSSARPLSDAVLDRVTAGGVSTDDTNGVIKFQGSVPTKNGLVTGAGTLSVLSSPMPSTTNQGSITLNGQAQQNLTSLINFNAVNSNVNVLLNFTVNINSTVGTLTQTNLTGKH